MIAISAAAHGVASASMATTVLSYAFVGASGALTMSALMSIGDNFAVQGEAAKKVGGNSVKRYTFTFVIGIVLMFLLLSVMNGFDFRDYIPGMWDPHQGERPTDYAPSKWASFTPNIWFEVLASDDDNSKLQASLNGEIVLDDEILKIKLSFDGGKSVFIYNAGSEGGLLLKGTCKFNSEKLIVTIDKKSDVIFNGQYDTITFTRKPTKVAGRHRNAVKNISWTLSQRAYNSKS